MRDTTIPHDAPHDVAAFFRRFERAMNLNTGPSFALVVMGEDGMPWQVTRANRTGLVTAGTALMLEAVDRTRVDPCICADCDAHSARAASALAAMGVSRPSAN